jgi:hypothetical protein
MNPPGKNRNDRQNRSKKPEVVATSRPQRDISKAGTSFKIPSPLLRWLAKINQRHITQNNHSS